MKFKSLFAALALCVVWSSSNAQNEQGQNVAAVNVGYSLAINFIKTTLDVYDEVETTSIPAIGLTFDHAITDNFSMGVAFGIQTLNADFKDVYADINNPGQNITDEVTAKIRRMNIAVRPLLHYGGSDNLDLYSGLRIGITSLSASYESNQADFSVGDFDNTRLSVGLVAFGMRYYFTDNIGANFDLQMGSPYILSAGIAARF